MIEEQVSSDTTTVEIKKFLPNAKHHVRVLAHNSRFNGPYSQLISFETPEGGNCIRHYISHRYTKPWNMIA